MEGSAGWGDAAVIIPWTFYQTYGDTRFLSESYESMKAWVEYMRANAMKRHWTKKINPRCWFSQTQYQKYIWDSGFHYGE